MLSMLVMLMLPAVSVVVCYLLFLAIADVVVVCCSSLLFCVDCSN
jgi:hypothetical protein